MSLRIKRKKKNVLLKLKHQDYYFKMRLIPYVKQGSSVVWLVSLAVAKSKRQINDWLNRRKKSSTCQLDSRLTGKSGNQIQAFAIRQLRQWYFELAPGDSLALRCESALPDKQFQVWKKWFERNEDPGWVINSYFKSFYIYKPYLLE
jgi:hypothetical protein